MKNQEQYISKREAADLLQKSTRQVDRYAKEEKWKYCYQKGSSQRKEKFYQLKDIESKAAELQKAEEETLRLQSALEKYQQPLAEELEKIRQWKEDFQREFHQEKSRISSLLKNFQQDLKSSLASHLREKPSVEQRVSLKEETLSSLHQSLEKLQSRTDLLEKILSSMAEKTGEKGSPSKEGLASLEKRLREIEEKQRDLYDQMTEKLGELSERFPPSSPPSSQVLVKEEKSLPSEISLEESLSPEGILEPPGVSPEEKARDKKEEILPARIHQSLLSPTNLEIAHQKMDQIYHNPELRETFLAQFTIFFLKGFWGTLMRIGLEIYQTLVLIWVWIIGYRRPAPGDYLSRKNHLSPEDQVVDLFKIAIWLGPTLYFVNWEKYEPAFLYFLGYLLAHFLLSFTLSLLLIEVSLLPSAWREIRMGEYEFERPFSDLLFLGFFLGPPIYAFFLKEYLIGLIYLMSYLGLHFLLHKIGKRFGRNWSLLPSPRRKGIKN